MLKQAGFEQSIRIDIKSMQLGPKTGPEGREFPELYNNLRGTNNCSLPLLDSLKYENFIQVS